MKKQTHYLSPFYKHECQCFVGIDKNMVLFLRVNKLMLLY